MRRLTRILLSHSHDWHWHAAELFLSCVKLVCGLIFKALALIIITVNGGLFAKVPLFENAIAYSRLAIIHGVLCAYQPWLTRNLNARRLSRSTSTGFATNSWYSRRFASHPVIFAWAAFGLESVLRADSPQVVDLGYAIYQGTFNSTSNITDFFAVRYAAPPVGQSTQTPSSRD
ncbi:uncharacterized protein FOMMEDRAFT_163021 [Fomitiporia mediterranea MF3/22]|uniref:Uncharacterized protein n=1 Tax=Fomitiporia mediterranea (strain MF3/22) TaxID=694068 RepID=R7SFL3_FOMME|nr:uncharacterized protein FOMMEDRAFT_163021 [Fomitiporia mediterranea MF3/22]EJC97516.1 hypothetical protein FOMMEDRAFT_163021 [Fomitiporia mediterranea MF3/22]